MQQAHARPSDYSRSNPSPRYRQLLGLYQTLHTEGEPHRQKSPEETFDGRSLPPQAWRIKLLIDRYSARTVLDYGAGKGSQYGISPFILPDGTSTPDIRSYWGVDAITLYDPGYAPHSTLPAGPFDGVISTDMLEHCAEEDLDWIIAEMFGLASGFLFVNIASYPAEKTLPDGQNAHCTIRPAAWWNEVLQGVGRRFPSVRWYAIVQRRETGPDGQLMAIEEFLGG